MAQRIPRSFAATRNNQSEVVIATNGLSKTYNGVSVLRDVALRVERHQIVALLGPNGAGKSTTMWLLLGLTRPSSGGGTIFGYDIERDSLPIRQRTGYLPQEPRFDPASTAREVLRDTAAFFFRGPPAAIEQRIVELLHSKRGSRDASRFGTATARRMA
jgi:ABC-2 type transport system ATP-binding protein